MRVQKGDFIELDFVGRVKSTNKIFDLTDEEIAKKEKIYREDYSYKPISICIGEKLVIKGLDKFLENKETGEWYKIEIKSEDAFGKKNTNLIKIVPDTIFRKENITPVPGMQASINNLLCTIRSVTGGRVIVDFNHPLAGQDLIYEVKINKKITSSKEKLEILASNFPQDPEIDIKEYQAIVKIKHKLPKTIEDKFKKDVKNLIPEIKNLKLQIIEQNDTIQE